MKSRHIKTLLYAAMMVIFSAGYALSAGFTVNAPPQPITPGSLFQVPISVNTSNYYIKYYRVRLLFDNSVIRLRWANPPAVPNSPEFTRPITADTLFGADVKLFDTNNYSMGCGSQGDFNLANLQFLALDGAASNTGTPIKIMVDKVVSCSNIDITSLFVQNYDGTLLIEAPVGTTTGVSQYLDLNGDGAFNIDDVTMMGQIISGQISNTTNLPLNVGGLQGDIDGNGLVDIHDLGFMNAMARDLKWCSTGPNGVAQTIATFEDVQLIEFGHGAPGKKCVSAGSNTLLETTPKSGSDDEVVWDWISTGPDGICDTTAGGVDDVQEITVDQGFPHGIMIKPGQDGEITSACSGSGDDAPFTSIKDIPAMLNNYPAPGRPTGLVKVWPTQAPYIVRAFNSPLTMVDTVPPVPLSVKVVDENGNPKVGLAPIFTVTSGGGWLDGPSGPATSVSGVTSDRFLGSGQYPTGISTVVFHPTQGSNAVTVFLPGDNSKGVLAPASVIFPVDVYSILGTQDFPDTLGLSITSPDVYLGETSTILLNMVNGSIPVGGLADRLLFVSSRNMESGFDARAYGLETSVAVFADSFENTDFPTSPTGMWEIMQGGSLIQRDNSLPGLFGIWSLRMTGQGIAAPIVIQHQANTSLFQQIQISYQWSYNGNPADGDYLMMEYSTDYGNTWITAHRASGNSELYCPLSVCLNQIITERRNMAGDSTAARNAGFYIRFTFAGESGAEFWLDNVSVSGVQAALEEDFEAQTLGDYPTGFDSVDRITTGPDGIAQTTADAGDTQLIDPGNGAASKKCIYGGLDNWLQTLSGGDDLEWSVDQTIDTGFNGICESTAAGDDFQAIPVGQGQAYSVAIVSGSDMVVTTSPLGDDKRQGNTGNNPDVAVDSTIGTTTGGNQGHNGSQKFAKIARSVSGPPSSYALRKIVNLASMENVWLIAYTRTLGLANIGGAEPEQTWVCEVSDNGGRSFVPVWDSSSAEEDTWTKHKVCLSCNSRVHMVDGFIIQWRAVMDNPELGADPDAAYVDDIQIFSTPSQPDTFGPIIDLGGGIYSTTISSIVPGTTYVSAMLMPYDYSGFPVYSNSTPPIHFNMRKVDSNSVKVLPETFTIKSCQSLDFNVIGHYQDQPGTMISDITPLYTFEVYGPARISPTGRLVADCFTESTDLDIRVNAIPLVPGLYDPGGGGEGQETGYIDGKVFSSVFPYPVINGSRVRILGASEFSASSGSDGSYFKSGVPVYDNYTVQAIKSGYVLDALTGIEVVSGMTTSENLFQDTGGDTDGDTVPDSSDSDDDGDDFADSQESIKGSSLTDPDTDGDGYADDVDVFPTNAGEWLDYDGDTVGDNTDSDDDADGISDAEENVSGADGYITNPKSTDTDGDTLGDYAEVNTNLTDPSKIDTDGGGRGDGVEITLGKNPRYGYYYDDNYAPTANAGADLFVLLGGAVYLDGQATSDPDGDVIQYTWVKLAGPASISLVNGSASLATFDATWLGTYTLSLQVKDTFTPQAWGTPDDVTVEVSDVQCNSASVNFGLYCWGDLSGDGAVSGADIIMMGNYLLSKATDLSEVYPSNADTADINGDEGSTGADTIVMQNWILSKASSSEPPASILVVTPSGSPTVPVGGMQTITLQVVDSDGTPRAGVGVLFTITGNGVLLGGRGDAAGLTDPDGGAFAAGSRWDVTSAMFSGTGGKATIFVQVTGAGSITVGARVPKNPAKGLTTSVTLSSPITINP